MTTEAQRTRPAHPMKGKIYPQTAFKVRQFARIMIENQCTIREAARIAGVSKGCIHYGVTVRLKQVDEVLYKEVQKVLNANMEKRAANATAAFRKVMTEKKQRKEASKRRYIGD